MEIVDISELALKKVNIEGNVCGKFSTFTIEQTYKNETKDVLEVMYTFPIVETATVVGFEVKVGDKVLKGICKEKEEARKEYQENIVKGNSAYLMEQQTDNIFRMAIGKIDKNEEVVVKIKYIDKLEIVDNELKLIVPTLVTPRYKSEVTSKLFYGKVDYTVDFKINIDKSVKLTNIASPSHKIEIVDKKNHKEVVVKEEDLSKDFKLDMTLKNELSSNALISKTKDNKSVISLSFMPEITEQYSDEEKEYLFLIDISGSMTGEKLEETKKAVINCLEQLDEGDRFNIIPFESKFTAMSVISLDYNDRTREKAIEYVNSLNASGGTEILNPIKFALYERDTEKTILLFTDGQVGNEAEILMFVTQNIGRNRIFPFGIDTNVNSYFIRNLAKVGQGKEELIMPKENISDKIIRTFARIQTPLLEELTIDYGKNKVEDEIKEGKVLFNFEFFNTFAKIDALVDDIKLKGKILGKEYSLVIKKEDVEESAVDLELVFAKLSIERLEEYIRNTRDVDESKHYKDMIVELAIKYSINSKYTSYLVINERDNKIFDVPRRQETVLSEQFAARGAGRALKTMRRDVDSAMFDIDMPAFLRTTRPKENPVEVEYEKFMNQANKSILTYLLFAIYYANRCRSKFNYEALLEFLKDRADEIKGNDLLMKLVCRCVQCRVLKVEDVAELLNDEYKKVLDTGMAINADLGKMDNEVDELLVRNI